MEPALAHLHEAIERADLHLPTPASHNATVLRQRLLDQISDYLLPRYGHMDAPVLAVVGGSTGAGKSTLVNSLVDRPVSRSGAVRPTTRHPVLVHHPEDAEWFSGTRVLPGLTRVHTSTTAPQEHEGGTALRMMPVETMPQGLALVDAPDLDSVVEANRAMSAQLLAAADLWVFVTTAHRYADAVPWVLLREAAERDVVVAVVLDRVPPTVLDEVSADLTAMLERHGLGRAPLFCITETTLSDAGLLPVAQVQHLQRWLQDLTADALARAEVVRRTLAGATTRALADAEEVAAALDEQAETAAYLRGLVEQAYDPGKLTEALSDGAMLRGEVLARWQDLVGASEFFQNLQTRIGRLRDRVGAFVTGKPRPAAEAEAAITDGLHTLLTAHADEAAARAHRAWNREQAGRVLISQAPIERSSAGFSDRAGEQIRAWQRYLLDLVGSEGAGKRTVARMLAFGVNGVGVALMVLVFASTGGLTGGEVAVAGGTAVVAQKVLEAIFGDDAVRRLTKAAREDLLARVAELMATEQARFTDLLPDAEATARAADLRKATAAVAAKVPR